MPQAIAAGYNLLIGQTDHHFGDFSIDREIGCPSVALDVVVRKLPRALHLLIQMFALLSSFHRFSGEPLEHQLLELPPY